MKSLILIKFLGIKFCAGTLAVAAASLKVDFRLEDSRIMRDSVKQIKNKPKKIKN